MNTVVITAPEAVVSWEEAKAHLRLDGDDEKVYVEALVAAATAWIDGPSGWLGRAIGEQALETRFAAFCDQMALMAPVIEIEAVTYLDENGDDQVVDEGFQVFGLPSCPYLGRTFGAHWPAGRLQDGAVRVRYTAGYEIVPPPIKQAILLLVGQWFDTRANVSVGMAVSEMPFAVTALLSTFRVWR